MDAAASAVSSNDSKMSSSRAPRSSSTVRRTTSKGSAGTWSRHFLNSSTSSAGNRPSPDEMIWPSLMYVGPRISAASRSRREITARLASVVSNFPRFCEISHGPIALASRVETLTTRDPGGSFDGLVSEGTSAWAWDRNVAASSTHRTSSRRTFQGPSWLNAAQSVSDRALGVVDDDDIL